MMRPSPQSILEAVARHYGLECAAITAQRRGARRQFLEAPTTTAAILMAHAGHANGAIARCLGCSDGAISNRLNHSAKRDGDGQAVSAAVSHLARHLEIALPDTAGRAGR